MNERPEAYALWARQGDLIVAGDHNSPSELGDYVHELDGTYLTPEEQDDWPFSAFIGWNCIQRRNAAVMTAYERGYRYVATVDDDNAPTSTWVSNHVAHLQGYLPHDTAYASGDRGWVDIGAFNSPPIRQRGTPFGAVYRHSTAPLPWRPKLFGGTEQAYSVVVSTAQVIGDPDCDAVMRITEDPQVKFAARNVVVDVRQYAAFNSQATMWDGEWAPLIACLPGVGRYDDIFASFIAKRIMREREATFFAGWPEVTQERNVHDALEDLCAELYGMQNTARFVSCLDATILDPAAPLDVMYQDCVDALEHFLPPQTVSFMNTWRKTWTELREKRG